MDSFSRDELEVAEIMATLPALTETWRRRQQRGPPMNDIVSDWSSRRRRSSIASGKRKKDPVQERKTAHESFEYAVAEKLPSKEIKSEEETGKKKNDKKKKKHKKMKTIEQCQQQSRLVRGDCGSVSMSAVVTTDHPEFGGKLPEIQSTTVFVPPTSSVDPGILPQAGYQFHHWPPQQQQPSAARAPLWKLGDQGAWTAIPDLNASVDENGEVIGDEAHHSPAFTLGSGRLGVDPTTIAAREARTKRMEICRRKKKLIGDGGCARTGGGIGLVR